MEGLLAEERGQPASLSKVEGVIEPIDNAIEKIEAGTQRSGLRILSAGDLPFGSDPSPTAHNANLWRRSSQCNTLSRVLRHRMPAWIESLSAARINRYTPAAKGDKHAAIRFYVWNARICEAFYLPIQLAEVTLRNTIHTGLIARYGSDWETRGAFLSTLPHRLRDELAAAITKERSMRGACLTKDHIVASLSFGFWANLLTRNHDHLLWKGGIHHAFRFAPRHITRDRLHVSVEQLRRWRNLIAHHYAIFDKRPTSEYQNLLTLVAWADPNTEWFISQLSNVSARINRRPRV